MLQYQQIISTRNFLSQFSKISKSRDDKKEAPIYFCIVNNGREAGVYIPPHKIHDFLTLHSPFQFLNKTDSKKNNISLKESFEKIHFKGEKKLSQTYKKLLYS